MRMRRPRGLTAPPAAVAARALLVLAVAAVAAVAGCAGADVGDGGEMAEAETGLGAGAECRSAGAVRVCGAGAVRAAAGRAAELACIVTNPGPLTVSWVRSRDLQIVAHAGVPFTADARVSADVRVSAAAQQLTAGAPPQHRHALRISAVRPHDAGRYECQLNTEPKIAVHFDLIVEDELPQVTVEAWQESDAEGHAGGRAVAACRAAAARGAALSVGWTRPGGGALPAAGVAVDTRRWAGGAHSRLAVTAPGRYECRAALADRADDAAAFPAVAAVTLHFGDDDHSDGSGAAEAMQGDEWAGRGTVAAGRPARVAPALLPLTILLLIT